MRWRAVQSHFVWYELSYGRSPQKNEGAVTLTGRACVKGQNLKTARVARGGLQELLSCPSTLSDEAKHVRPVTAKQAGVSTARDAALRYAGAKWVMSFYIRQMSTAVVGRADASTADADGCPR